MAKKRKTRRKFTQELKAEVVKLVLDGGRSDDAGFRCARAAP